MFICLLKNNKIYVHCQKLSEKWGQPVVIENRSGAGGNIGMDAVAKAPGDGHTLLMSYVGSHAINPSIYSKLPFDPEADFVAVATLANVPFVAAINASVPVTNMKGLVAYASQKPVSFGSAGKSAYWISSESFSIDDSSAGISSLAIAEISPSSDFASS